MIGSCQSWALDAGDVEQAKVHPSPSQSPSITKLMTAKMNTGRVNTYMLLLLLLLGYYSLQASQKQLSQVRRMQEEIPKTEWSSYG